MKRWLGLFLNRLVSGLLHFHQISMLLINYDNGSQLGLHIRLMCEAFKKIMMSGGTWLAQSGRACNS